MAYIGKSPSQGVRNRFQYQATAGQTSFSGSDANSLTLTYTDSLYLDVYQNGILLVPGDDYTATTGTTAQDDNYGVIVAGHDSAVATAEQINKTETYRDPDSFADIVRGMHLYGRKILRPEALVTAKYNLA